MKYSELIRLYDVLKILLNKCCHEIVVKTIDKDGARKSISYCLCKNNWFIYNSYCFVSYKDGNKTYLEPDYKIYDIIQDLYHKYYNYDTITLKHRLFKTMVFTFELSNYHYITTIENSKMVSMFYWLNQNNIPRDISTLLVKTYKEHIYDDIQNKIRNISDKIKIFS
jgi:hypothetical protein